MAVSLFGGLWKMFMAHLQGQTAVRLYGGGPPAASRLRSGIRAVASQVACDELRGVDGYGMTRFTGDAAEAREEHHSWEACSK